MTIGKKTFAAKTFASNTFASGTWRGVGVAIVTPDPDRLYVSLGLYREFIVGLGVTREIVMGVER